MTRVAQLASSSHPLHRSPAADSAPPPRKPGQRPRTRALQPRSAAFVLVIVAVVAVLIALTITTSTVPRSLATPPGYSASDLKFNYSASGSAVNPIDWDSYIISAGSQGVAWNSNGKGGSSPAGYPNYDAEYDLPGQVSESNGVIDIRATKTPTEGMLGDTPTLYPFASGVLSSYGKFEFTGGYVQIEAKMPRGAGLWPGLWMLPGAGVASAETYEIDIFEGGADDGGSGSSSSDMYSWHLHTPNGTFGSYTNSHVDLTAKFNTYGLRWIPGKSITWYLNGNVIGELTSAQTTIPNEPMELIMNLQVANANAASFHSVYNSTTPTTSDMLISAVQVYS
jgi:beta-glucanase (GH16 family)